MSMSGKACIMKTLKLIGWFLLISFFGAFIWYVISGDGAILAATGEVKFRLSRQEKLIEASVIGLFTGFATWLAYQLFRVMRKRVAGSGE